MPIITNWNLILDVEDVLRSQGMNPAVIRSRRPALADLAARALQQARPLLNPRVAYQLWDVETLRHEKLILSQGKTLTGPLILQHLSRAKQVAAVIGTIGDSLDALVSSTMSEDMAYALALDGVGSAAAEALGTAACKAFEQQAVIKGWRATLPLSPGMNGWPTDTGQRQLFALFDPADWIVQLTPSSLMLPRKSVSFLVGFGPDVQTLGVSCDYCDVRVSCRFRREHELPH
jgi:hypothetical protein